MSEWWRGDDREKTKDRYIYIEKKEDKKRKVQVTRLYLAKRRRL